MQARIVQIGDDQVVLIPAELAFDDDIEVEIVREGDVIWIYPAHYPSKEAAMSARVDPK